MIDDPSQKAGNKLAAFATQGDGSSDQERLRLLLEGLDVDWIPFSRGGKRAAFLQVLRHARCHPDRLLVMEGTGTAGGLAVILASWIFGARYVFSSGDAVAPYLAAKKPLWAPAFLAYEKMLCRRSSGFIGWSPYLVGRALTLGAPRGVTAAGWALQAEDDATRLRLRREYRERLGLSESDIVFGIAGSLNWTPRVSYCYGLELVQAIRRVDRPELKVVVVGDGSGLERIRQAAGDLVGSRVLLPGRVARGEVAGYLCALDVGSLPQSVDGVGSFRYTTKISEYLGCGLPIATNQIPLAYDLDHGGLWRLPGASPWDEIFVKALACLMRSITPEQVAKARKALPRVAPLFERAQQVRAVQAFLADVASIH